MNIEELRQSLIEKGILKEEVSDFEKRFGKMNDSDKEVFSAIFLGENEGCG